MVISKSEYVMFLKHPAWLWLKKFDKSKLPEVDENVQARFDDGFLFETYAERLFPKAVKLGYKNGGEFDGMMYRNLPLATKAEVDKGTKVIFQGRVEIKSLTCIFDVLERVGENAFNLYEIKSSTSAKEEHEHELAFQTIVLEEAGLEIRNISVIHVNKDYERHGDIDVKQLTAITEITEEVRARIPWTIENIEKALTMLKKKAMPDPSPRYLGMGPMSEWLSIFEKIRGSFPEDSIYNLSWPNAKMMGELEDLGIEKIGEIPDDFKLRKQQEFQVESTKKNKQIIDKKEIKNFLGTLVFPLHFFDYETMSSVIPNFDGLHPYQQLPFQYSLHILKKPDEAMEHKEYLHTENSNPAIPLLEKMKEDFEGKGSVIVWNKKFEIARNKELADLYPQYEKFLLGVNDRIVDLMIPFSEGFFVDKKFFGSASLKAVLPVIIPGGHYDELEISGGGTAQRLWMETILGGEHEKEKDKNMEDLKKYCGKDTYAMWEIWDFLTKVSR